MINTVFVCVFICLVLFVRIIEFKTETTPPKDIFYFSRERLLNLKKHKAREIFCLPFWSSIVSEDELLFQKILSSSYVCEMNTINRFENLARQKLHFGHSLQYENHTLN